MIYTKNKNIVPIARCVIFVWLLSFIGFCVQAQSPDTVRFIHISDPHICFLDGLHPVIQKKRSHYGEGVATLESFLETFSQKPALDFISITGDLIDFYQAVSPDLDLVENQIKQFVPILQKSGVPVYMNMGNHDIATNLMDDGDNRWVDYYAHEARATWIRSLDCFEHGTYYSKILQAGSTTYRLIFLDNGYYFEREQLEWLDWQLSQSQDDVEIIFMHIPFYPDKKQKAGNQQLYDLLMRYDSVKLILAGHEHVNEVHSFGSDRKDQLIQVMTGAFGRDRDNWRLVELTASGIKVSQPGSEEDEIIISN